MNPQHSPASPVPVSIVVPCFNQERFIAACIESARSQTERRWELIVVDDGSTDGSVSAAHSAAGGDPRITVAPLPHGGVGYARNAGAAHGSHAPFLLFFDADDEMEPRLLECLLRELESHPEVAMVHSLVSFIDDAGQRLPGTPGMHPRYVRDGWKVRALEDAEVETPFCAILALAGIIPSCSMMRRSAFQAAGGWDDTFGQGFEDTDLFLRLALHGPIHQFPERLVRHRRHAGQSSDTPGRHEAQLIKLHARWRDLGRLPPDQRSIVAAAWRFYDRQLTWHAATAAARRLSRERHPATAVRFLGGGALRVAKSCARPPK